MKTQAEKTLIARTVLKHTSARSVSWLFGPGYIPARREIMQAITGKRLPIAKVGINAMMDALYEVFPSTGDCIAGRENHLGELIEAAASVPDQSQPAKTPASLAREAINSL